MGELMKKYVLAELFWLVVSKNGKYKVVPFCYDGEKHKLVDVFGGKEYDAYFGDVRSGCIFLMGHRCKFPLDVFNDYSKNCKVDLFFTALEIDYLTGQKLNPLVCPFDYLKWFNERKANIFDLKKYALTYQKTFNKMAKDSSVQKEQYYTCARSRVPHYLNEKFENVLLAVGGRESN